LGTARSGDRADLRQAIDAIARGQVVLSLVCEEVLTTARGCQVLLDSDGGLKPFARDCRSLIASIRGVVGREQTSLFQFRGCPTHRTETMTGDVVPYRPPARGTPVVLITDLGIGERPLSRYWASAEDWDAFLGTVRNSRCPLIAFVPYPPHRWPHFLRRKAVVIQWDRTTTAGGIRQSREKKP
jgi:hypothetical protein